MQAIYNQYSILVQEANRNPASFRGVYITPRKTDASIWDGIVFVRSGLYSQGIFRFLIEFPKHYEGVSVYPRLVFTTRLYHPLIPQSHEVLPRSMFTHEHTSSEPHVKQIVSFIHCLFELTNITSQSAVNSRVWSEYQTYLSEKDTTPLEDIPFVLKVRQCVQESIDGAYDADSKCMIKPDRNVDVSRFRTLLLKHSQSEEPMEWDRIFNTKFIELFKKIED
ncbi:hypothetical protein P9112_012703 [Eukaryota sp. TZLM1-RC]